MELLLQTHSAGWPNGYVLQLNGTEHISEWNDTIPLPDYRVLDLGTLRCKEYCANNSVWCQAYEFRLDDREGRKNRRQFCFNFLGENTEESRQRQEAEYWVGVVNTQRQSVFGGNATMWVKNQLFGEDLFGVTGFKTNQSMIPSTKAFCAFYVWWPTPVPTVQPTPSPTVDQTVNEALQPHFCPSDFIGWKTIETEEVWIKNPNPFDDNTYSRITPEPKCELRRASNTVLLGEMSYEGCLKLGCAGNFCTVQQCNVCSIKRGVSPNMPLAVSRAQLMTLGLWGRMYLSADF